MSEAYLIKNTTKEQREEIVRNALYGDDSCDGGVGGLGEDFYQPYIDGRLEIFELNRQFQTHYISEEGPDESKFGRSSCVMGY